jgi:hypothetical protein
MDASISITASKPTAPPDLGTSQLWRTIETSICEFDDSL